MYPLANVLDDKPKALSIEFAMPISAVRLVHPILDPKTGKTRDVVIQQLRHADTYSFDTVTGKSRPERIVPGLNVIIPWPKKGEENFTDHPVDTLRINVEERTFVPTLLRPPMPEGIIDELRNKYSRFRTRHDPEYIARKEAEEQAKQDRIKLMESMRTPMEEYAMAEAERKKRNGKPRLTLEMLEEIGKVIAKNRERTLNAAGVTDVTPQNVPASIQEPSKDETSPAPPPPPSS
jgi:large subunit ribosomal protein L24